MNKDFIRVFQVSDTHLFKDTNEALCGQNTHDSFQAVLTDIRKQEDKPDFIVATGDVSQDQSVESYHRFRDAMSSLNTPVYCLPGNHDDPALLNQTMGMGRVQTKHVHEEGPWVLLLLNSVLPNETKGHLSKEELAFLESSLDSTKGRPVLISMHHSPLLMESEWLDTMILDNHKDFFQVIDQYSHVRCVLWGHIHQEYEGERRRVKMIGSPSTCVQFKPRQNQFGFDNAGPAYRWLHLYSNGHIETGVIRVSDFKLTVNLDAKGY